MDLMMERLGKGMILTEEEEELLIIPQGAWTGHVTQEGYYLVGRLLAPRPYRLEYLRNTLVPVINPVKGMDMREIGCNRYLYTSYGGGTRNRSDNGDRGSVRCGGDIFSAPCMLQSGIRELREEGTWAVNLVEHESPPRKGDRQDRDTMASPTHNNMQPITEPHLTQDPGRHTTQPTSPPSPTRTICAPAQPTAGPRPKQYPGQTLKNHSPHLDQAQHDVQLPQPVSQPEPKSVNPDPPTPKPESPINPEPVSRSQINVETAVIFSGQPSPSPTTPPTQTNPDIHSTADVASQPANFTTPRHRSAGGRITPNPPTPHHHANPPTPPTNRRHPTSPHRTLYPHNREPHPCRRALLGGGTNPIGGRNPHSQN
ncbi:hypothetical protein Salat_0880300 [Sesamum alatum]|uniref:Uncharacterized protein n=1 Tax=Sesamum alatum TaxID=300844 RepID=A0AAE1YJE8_9LAMI|nr:hypothetical protein Salat_0880300 [Sesamum alatum]